MACNRVPHSLTWGSNGVVAFGACNSVALYDPSVSFIVIHVIFGGSVSLLIQLPHIASFPKINLLQA